VKAGAPSADPDTKVWLEAHLDTVFGLPSLVRFSWATTARLLEERAVPVRWCGARACQGRLPECVHARVCIM
jgi:hypothetical protein